MDKRSILKQMQVVLVQCLLFSLQGCGKGDNEDPYYDFSKDELVSMLHGYETTISTLNTELAEKTTLLQGIQSQTEPTTAIQTMTDGTGRLTFNEFSDGTVVFPNELQYPDSEVQTTNNRVFITDNVCFKPGESWNIMLNGNKVELENSDLGIGAQIQVGYRDGDYLVVDYIQDYMMDNFFVGWPPENITYQVIMNGETKTGVDAYTHTFIDSQDAWVRIGMLCYGNSTVTYTACYIGNESSVANKAIKDLIEQIEIGGTNVQIEG